MSEYWSVAYYYSKLRNSALKPTATKTVYLDPQGERWYVDDPEPMSPEDREDTFMRLMALRGMPVD